MPKRTGDDKTQKPGENGALNQSPEVIVDELFAGTGFFDPSDIAQMKYEMLRRVANGQSVAEAIRAFGFPSLHSFYEAQAAFKRNGLAGLVENTETSLVNKFVSEHLEIDFVMRRVRAGNKSIRLTPKEFDLLRYLVSQAGKPIPHRELLSAVWGPDSADQIDYLRVFITYLRNKIEPDPANPQYILTEPWVGYRFLGFDE
jgi:DNA-binding response OmpR family regulator